MSVALVTFATGNYTAFLEIARPSFVAYTERHGYEYVEVAESDEAIDLSRPPSWSKVPVLLRTLESHDAALWVDCDAVVVDGVESVASLVPDGAWQAMALHHTHNGFDMGKFPSCGTWFLRQAMISVLQQAWTMTKYIHYPWWEQAAMHELMGYVHNGTAIFPVRQGAETELRRNTHFLADEWACVDSENFNAHPRVMHVPSVVGLKERLRLMRYWAERAAT